MQIKETVKFHNRYDVQVIDSVTGRIKQEAHAENVVLDNVWQLIIHNGTNSSNTSRSIYTLGLGTGTGEPSSSDTGLFTSGATLALTTSNTVLTSSSDAYPTSSYVYRIDVPANSTYVGEYTEIAMMGRKQTASSSYTNLYWSHAMFEDAEGNPITIKKTDLDVLVVTFTVYVTLGAADDNFMWIHPSRNLVNQLFRAGLSFVEPPFVTYTDTSNSLTICSCLIHDGQTISEWAGISLGNGSGYQYQADHVNHTLTCPTQRLGTETGNNTYYHGLIFADATSGTSGRGTGGILFPNTNVFPNRPIVGASVGAGDGETTDFDVPVPYFIEGTDSIYVDGVKMTRGVDYTLPNSSNVKKLACVQPNRHMRIISNGQPGNTQFTAHVPFSATEVTTTNANLMFNTAGPMIFELLDTAPIDRFNFIKLSLETFDSYGMFCYKTTADSGWLQAYQPLNKLAGVKLIVDVSSDRSAWDHVHTFDLGTYTATYSRSWWSGSDHFASYYMYIADLDAPKQFKYVRFTLDHTGATSAEVASMHTVALMTTVTTYSKDPYGYFTHTFEQNDKELPLHFANPPAAGAAITMDATINRPFKTNQHVIDMSMTLQM